ncbi:MAG: DUF3313 family protein [Elusimicrobia bacterium]|nr:DUF3313 family protein [Elusimicrobiota bacterium]
MLEQGPGHAACGAARAALILLLAAAGSGCAGNRVYVDPAKTAAEMRADEQSCRARTADSSEELREQAYGECMKAVGYQAVSQSDVGKVKGFSKSWVDQDVDFKVYEAVFIDSVDASEVATKRAGLMGLLDEKVKPTPQEAAELAARMREAMVKFLGPVIKVETTREAVAGRKAMALRCFLESVKGADPEANVAAKIFIHTTVSSAEAVMRCVMDDAATGAPLITLADKHSPNQFTDDNVTMLGSEGFTRWTGAYRIMEHWADRLAAFLAAKRGQPYKSPFVKKVI